jgi:hypothetical protein
MLSEVFLSFLVSSCIACVLALGQYIFKSKCDEIKCCCIKIHRRVDLEGGSELQQIELPQPLTTLTKPKRESSLDSIINKK